MIKLFKQVFGTSWFKEKSHNQEIKENLTSTTTKKASESETQKPTNKKEAPAPDKK